MNHVTKGQSWRPEAAVDERIADLFLCGYGYGRRESLDVLREVSACILNGGPDALDRALRLIDAAIAKATGWQA
jgi:hypothetical protein